MKSKTFINNVISNSKRKSYNTFSNDCQNRHYTQDSFYVISKKDSITKRKIFEFNKSICTEEVGTVDTYASYVLSLNQSIYFLSTHSIKCYSILTRKWKHLINFSHPYMYAFCACIFMGKIHIFDRYEIHYVVDPKAKTIKINGFNEG